MRKSRKDRSRPVVALRDMVVFPGSRVPFVVGRLASVEAVRAAVEEDSEVLLVMQRDPAIREPAPRDLHSVGTLARIVAETRLSDGNYKLVVEGLCRARITAVVKEQVHLSAQVVPHRPRSQAVPREDEARTRIQAALDEYAEFRGAPAEEGSVELPATKPLAVACDELVVQLPLESDRKQEVLEAFEPEERIAKVEALLDAEIDTLRIDRHLNREVQRKVSKSQRDFILHEKMKVIREELGLAGGVADLEQLRERLEAAGLPAAAREKADEELARLEVMPSMSAEATVARTWLEWMIALPWKRRSRERRDFDEASAALHEDHHGLDRVKERVLEFLAVRALRKGKPARGSILCFVGPPGVGKTSLGRSIARATGRKFVRLSLGGVRDEAEIRGHRRTYVGAYPGRIIQGLKKAGTRNPVFLLDEVDKMAADFRGDPAAALLEVLDPEQNSSFLDHYLDIEFDLSEVMFLCTANVLHAIPPALQDRLEIIRLPGYSPGEKRAIAERFLLPRQLEENGLDEDRLTVSGEALDGLIDGYTREAGVRGLERELASLCRKVAARVVRKPDARVRLRTAADLKPFLGAPRFRAREAERAPEVGVATGLSWTAAGGQLLPIEAALHGGKGGLLVTGQVGEVMQESLKAAVTWARSRATELGVPESLFAESDIHVHVPEGAIPKDGPSAGVTLAVAVVSVLTGRPVRSDLAMTGEITLRGRVLPVGGVREKLLAAQRAGLHAVLLPKGCERELEEVPPGELEDLELIVVETMDEVVEQALVPLRGGRRTRQAAGRRRSAARSRGGRERS